MTFDKTTNPGWPDPADWINRLRTKLDDGGGRYIALTAALLTAEATAYTLRHSTITDLVRHGLPLLTIAQISGTSAEKIERHYGHLARDAAVKALAGLAL